MRLAAANILGGNAAINNREDRQLPCIAILALPCRLPRPPKRQYLTKHCISNTSIQCTNGAGACLLSAMVYPLPWPAPSHGYERQGAGLCLSRRGLIWCFGNRACPHMMARLSYEAGLRLKKRAATSRDAILLAIGHRQQAAQGRIRLHILQTGPAFSLPHCLTYSTARATSTALLPPKANELDITVMRRSTARPLPGT